MSSSDEWGTPSNNSWGQPATPPPHSDHQVGNTGSKVTVPTRLVAIAAVAVVALAAVGVVLTFNVRPSNCSLQAVEESSIGYKLEYVTKMPYCNGTWMVLHTEHPDGEISEEVPLVWDGDAWDYYERNSIYTDNGYCFEVDGLKEDKAPKKVIKLVSTCP
ncbi:MAG: hypothetical protein SOW59_03680 [Corynebacterium sp.]|nr:hypothetical protein [Corynebacterium sp.]